MSYDRALTVFSPNGHLLQIEHAMEAVQRGACSVGVEGKDSLVLCVQRKSLTQLQDSCTMKKILQIDENIYLAFSGLTADARVLAGTARNECQSFMLNYEDRMDVEYLGRFIAHHQQRYTQSGGRRPFGVSTIIAGIDNDGKCSLYMTDPSGFLARWHAVSCGPNSKTVTEYLEKTWKPDQDADTTLKTAVRGLLEVVDQGAKSLEVVQLRVGHEARFLSEDEVAELVKTVEAEREQEEAAKKPKKN
eukprot:TRINITY_DN6079_c0_g1_i1.p1 TRINITY_DN6079_c0_g1~~TRINITY_DN6079_c0_g1_i1.p1  ORF type:complete len:264 (+),score=128.18 TRINITY_DN6079_c0_g1_i1:54-794(+)